MYLIKLYKIYFLLKLRHNVGTDMTWNKVKST